MRWQRSALWVIVFALLGTLVAGFARDAGAFTVEDNFASGQEIFYWMDDTTMVNELGAGAPAAIRAGDQAWEAHDPQDWTKLTHNNTAGPPRTVLPEQIEDASTLAYARPVGCLALGGACVIAFDNERQWYTGTGTPGAGQFDLRSTAAHEFGHWLGMHHSGGVTGCPDPDLLASDNNARPTMEACAGGPSTDRRTIAQDDINGFHVARQSSPLPTANDSFEYTGSTYGWGYSPRGGGGVSRICDGTSYHRSCRVQDTGVGTSIYQDIVSRGVS